MIADVTGDAMMAIWCELPPAKQKQLACLAALDMAAAVEAFNQATPLAPLATRIGLHQGELTLGRWRPAGPAITALSATRSIPHRGFKR